HRTGTLPVRARFGAVGGVLLRFVSMTLRRSAALPRRRSPVPKRQPSRAASGARARSAHARFTSGEVRSTSPDTIAPMDARGIHHLGVAVDDLDEALSTYTRLFGAELEQRATVPDQGVEAAAVLVGEGRVELLSPLEGETPVGRFLASRGPGMHHVAFEVADIDAALESLRRE